MFVGNSIEGGKMRIIEDFEFIYERKEYIEKVLGIKKKNLEDARDAIQSSIDWLEGSSFKSIVAFLRIHLVDLPIKGTMAFVGVDEDSEEVTVYINISNLVDDYEKETYKGDFSFADDITCAEYASFIFLHEIGHVVHAQLQSIEKGTPKEKMEEYFTKYNSFYKKLEMENSDLSHIKVKRMYRKIPSEREADNFANKYFKQIKGA